MSIKAYFTFLKVKHIVNFFSANNKAEEGGKAKANTRQPSRIDRFFLLFKDACANCFCASLLHTAARTNSHVTDVMHRARAPSTKMNNDRADGHCCSFGWI